MRKSLLALIVLTPFVGGGCSCGGPSGNGPDRPAPVRSAAEYSGIVTAFTISALALETDDPTHTVGYLTKVTELAWEEPAGWANLGLYQLNKSQFKEAGESLARAARLSPPHPGIEKLLALLAEKTGDLPGAIQHYQKAVELAPDDLRARYALAEQLERQGTPEGDTAYQAAMQAILDRQPYNLVAQGNLARIAAKRNDAATLQKTIALLEARASTFNPSALGYLKELKAAAAAGDTRKAAITSNFLLNVLKPNIAFFQSSLALQKPTKEGPEPLRQFIKLPPIPATPAAPDMALTYDAAPLFPKSDPGPAAWAGAFWRDETGALSLMTADGHAAHLDSGESLPFPGGASAVPPGVHGILDMDMNYDLKNDLVFAGGGGIRLYQQSANSKFVDVTAKSKLPASVLTAAYTGAWSMDIEADGDLDIVLGSASGPPTVLRNNGDGTWKVMRPFAGVAGLLDFVWVDLDGDGSTDVALIDGAGKLRVFANQRAGLFSERAVPAALGTVIAISAADVNNDGRLDLLALQADGAILRISDKEQGKSWDIAEIARWANKLADLKAGTARLMVADLDNNGGIDLIASTPSTSQVWLCDEKAAFAPLSAPTPGSVRMAVDLDKNGLLDFVGVSAQNTAVRFIAKGSKSYNWQEMRVHAKAEEVVGHAKALATRKPGDMQTGDAPVNPFGIGGEVETRAGLLYLKQAVLSPTIHVGLGAYPSVDAVRVIWPNGDVRAEFGDGIKANSSVGIEHRLTGSCPWVFAWNGREMGFVTDFIWRSPVGLRINAQDTAGMEQTEDWVKIRGDQLVPRDGYYDVRITAELWETHFFDYVRLMAVDHLEDTEVFVDERFSRTPPKLRVHTFTPPKPVARAIDDNGADVTDIVRNIDGSYLDTFGRGTYQGITRDHYVEFELGPDAPTTGPLYLIASGWIHPTDSSINVAVSQGSHAPPSGLSLEVPDGKGGWRTAKPGLGFPAGKTKTILIRLDDVASLSAADRYAHAKSGSRRINSRQTTTQSPPARTNSADFVAEGRRRALSDAFLTAGPASNSNTTTGSRQFKFRLRTNLEIYWDRLAFASEISNARIKQERLPPQSAELRYRGYSTLNKANASSPELPDYEHKGGSGTRWRDLIGFCTRFGDVRELLERVDDSYVIMNAGDEMAMRFPALSPPAQGWKRDFVLIGDGWEKDGNLNTAYSKTILPLPFHGQKSYNTPPSRLEDDPAYKLHPADWQKYHTRYITPEGFENALRPGN